MKLIIFCLLIACGFVYGQLPTVYEHYTAGGIVEGLKAINVGTGGIGYFTLNGKPITLYSGAIHYFRIHPDYWRDRLKKVRATGFNAVETYVPWNLHEPEQGTFDFGDGGNDLSLMLNVTRFIEMAKEEDLLVIFRPGPYICSEWEFGGLPSWLLRTPNIKVRTSDPNFINPMTGFFDALLAQVAHLRFTNNGGPIIAMQIENEYGNFGGTNDTRDKLYLETIRDIYIRNGMDSLYFTSDSPALSGDLGACPGELQTANFDNNPVEQLDTLLALQPGMPVWAMEYWTGWFDHWFERNHAVGNTPEELAEYLLIMFSQYNASVNFYMFHGGTSFAFMNGANVIPGDVFPEYAPDVTSYDYSAPLTEPGDYTEKYDNIVELVQQNKENKSEFQFFIPPRPQESVKVAYPPIAITEYLPFSAIIGQVPLEDITTIQKIDENSSMEALPFNNGNGQSYGMILYEATIIPTSTQATLQIIGHVRDIAIIFLDGVSLSSAPTGQASLTDFGMWPVMNGTMTLTNLEANNTYKLGILVDNMARNNFGTPNKFNQKKGLWEGPVLLDGQELFNWDVRALQLKGSWVNGLTGWMPYNNQIFDGPAMYRTNLVINSQSEIADTFLEMGYSWNKGCVYINGFPLGRYFSVGPQITNYLPAPFLIQGQNQIVIFEHYRNNNTVYFNNATILEKP